MSVPTMALAMPPPVSPTGLGMWRKKSRLSPENPRESRWYTIRPSGSTTSATESPQAPRARAFEARRMGLGPRAISGAAGSRRAGDIAPPAGRPVHEHAGAGIEHQGDREQHQRDLEQRRQVELAGGLRELVGDHARHGRARGEQ